MTAVENDPTTSGDTTSQTMLDVALAYARAGIPVFPLRGKRPYEDGGFKTATTDEATIRGWWGRWPDANIGTPTGYHVDAVTGEPNARPFVVLDADVKNDGPATLQQLIDQHSALPATVQQVTGTGGSHVAFAANGPVRGFNDGRMGPGLDFKADGGYIVIAPSIHPDTGEPYVPVEGHGLLEHDLAAMPGWLKTLIDAAAGRRAEAKPGERIPYGVQEATLMRMGGAMRRLGATEAEILAAFRTISEERCDPPVLEKDLARMAGSVCRYDPARGDNWNNFSAKEVVAAIPVPPFPLDVFPPKVRQLIADGTKALGCPADMIAAPFLSYAGAAIGNTATIRIKRSFRQRPILWTVMVAPSGSMKSPADKVARFPLAMLQLDAALEYEKAYAEYEEAKEGGDAVTTSGGIGDGGGPKKPKMAHYLTTDATFESLSLLLKAAPGVVMARDEIVGLVKACDAYRGGRGGDRQRYLEAWDGTPMKVDRKSQEPVFVAAPTLCIAGGCQPAVLPELTREASQYDGFIPRFNWCYPDVAPTAWSWDDVDDQLVEDVKNLLAKLREREPYEVELGDEAKARWAEWMGEIRALQTDAEGMAESVLAKLSVQVARVALVLHCLWNPGTPDQAVTRDRLDGAIRVGEYFRRHADRVLAYFDGSVVSAPLLDRVERALARHGGEWVTKTTLFGHLGSGVSAEELNNALASLRDTEKAETRTEPGKTKPFEQWRLCRDDSRN